MESATLDFLTFSDRLLVSMWIRDSFVKDDDVAGGYY